MRTIEFIVKSVAVWLTLDLALRIPIFLGWVTETDRLASVIIVTALLLSLFLTGFAVFAQRRLALYGVLFTVGALRLVSVLFVLVYPIYYAWNLYGFWGAAGAFFLPVISQAWAMYMNIKQGMWGFAMVIGIMIVSIFIYNWCRFKIPGHGTCA
jgi:hypothetical protein